MVADFWDAMEEAERVRTLGLMGLHELTCALEREEARLRVAHDAPDLMASDARSLQAAYERSEWAKAELANDSPHANAQALISMTSALDAMVEELVKHWRRFHVERIADDIIAKGQEAAGHVVEQIEPNALAAVQKVVRREAERIVPAALRPRGPGIARFERPLKRVGWGAPEDRPIPDDLEIALTELGAVRNVLVHRAGRIDAQALKQAPTLPYQIGQFVRLSREDYRRYSAAVRCYAQEICFRGIRSWPEVSDDRDGPNLAAWRDYVRVTA